MRLALLGLLGLAVLGAVVALIVVLLLSRRRSKKQQMMTACPMCFRMVPADAERCPHCDQPLHHTPDIESTLERPAISKQMQAQPRLVALEGALAGDEFLIPDSPTGLAIGREASSDIALRNDPLVSRQHAQIILENEQYVLYDRNSVNGVFVNDERVMRHVLVDDDVIQICNSSFRFALGAARPPAPTPPEVSQPSDEDVHATDSMRLPSRTNFEGYVLDRKVGQGGMSVVYKAHDLESNPVAIKVLDVTDDYVVRKFIQEGEIGVALSDHPNICTVYRSGKAQDNRLYMVMEFIDGHSLRSLVSQGLSDDIIVDIVGQVCDALHYAHLRHVVHRDIKPENILIDSQDIVKVADFGIAKLTSSVTVTKDRLMGTPEYISPEQARAQRILPTSDIYSVGVVLYELLVGKPPFQLPYYDSMTSERVAFNKVLYAHIHTKPQSPSQIKSGISKKLERVVLKALEKDPKRRFDTAWDMAQALGYRRKIATPPAPRQISASLVNVRGSQKGKRLTLGDGAQVFGRPQIAPDDMYLSKQHFGVSTRGEQLWLEDMSRNGTWVNGERVYGEVLLKAGDEIVVGHQVLRLEM